MAVLGWSAAGLTWFFGAICVFSSLYVALSRDLFRMSLAFFLELAGVGGILLSLNADYLAIILFATAILGQAATPETVFAFRHQVGLDHPPVLRYLYWIGGVLQGNFGESFSSAGSLAGGKQ